MQTTFFNTTSLQGDALVVATKKAIGQSELILKVFKAYPTAKFTPFDVHYNIQRIYGKDYPITSVRARMTVLTDNGHLIKSEKAEGMGIYKVSNHRWQLNTNSDDLH